jgi:hypothetical protein
MFYEVLLRLAGEVGPGATWLLAFLMFTITVFVVYIGIALLATLVTKDPLQGELRYRIFHDLLGLFDRRRRR